MTCLLIVGIIVLYLYYHIVVKSFLPEEDTMEKRLSRVEREKIQIERTILQHAEDLFKQGGYENTTMGMLAKSCEYTTRTIYRYFSCKEDLYFAVLLKGHIGLLETAKTIAQSDYTGKEKIMLGIQAFRDFHAESGYLFDLMSQIKAIRSKKQPDELPFYQRYEDCAVAIHREFVSFYTLAHEDKSIRTDVDASMFGFSSIFVLNGFFHMLSMTGDRFTRHFSLDMEQFIEFTLKLLLELLDGDK